MTTFALFCKLNFTGAEPTEGDHLKSATKGLVGGTGGWSGEISLVGGRDDVSELPNREVVRFDEGTGLFETLGVDDNLLPAQQQSRGCVMRLGNFVYLIGGAGVNGSTDRISRATVITP